MNGELSSWSRQATQPEAVLARLIHDIERA
jgi:hypothetical protein